MAPNKRRQRNKQIEFFAFPSLTLQAVQVIHMDALEVTEQNDQDGQTNCRLSCSKQSG